MPESKSHKAAKRKAAGGKGKTEVPLKSGKRLDAQTPRKATEIEKSGNPDRLREAAKRLKESKKPQKVLQVPEKDMKKAADAMRKENTSGTVKNLSNTKKRPVRKRK